MRRAQSFLVSDIRGYDISETRRGEKALYIYLNNFDCLHFNLFSKIDREQLDNFLQQHLKKIDQHSNPNYPTFSAAYGFALKKCILYLIVALPIILLYILFIQNSNLTEDKTPVKLLGSAILSFLIWLYFFKKPVQRGYFRNLAYSPGTNFFIYLSPLLLFFVVEEYNKRTLPMISLNYPMDIQGEMSNILYAFKEVGFDPEKSTVTHYIYEKGTRRSKHHKLTHYFLTPITNGDRIIDSTKYWFWAVKIYKQKIFKHTDYQTAALKFQKEKRMHFINLYRKEPSFYKPIAADDIAHIAIRSNVYAGRSPLILEPHWETIEEYRANIFRSEILLLIALIGINALWCLYTAKHR